MKYGGVEVSSTQKVARRLGMTFTEFVDTFKKVRSDSRDGVDYFLIDRKTMSRLLEENHIPMPLNSSKYYLWTPSGIAKIERAMCKKPCQGTAYTIGEAAKNTFGIGRNRLFKRLICLGFLMRDRNGIVPKQEYIKRGYFKVHRGDKRDISGTYEQTLITDKGIEWLKSKLGGCDAVVRN